MMRTALGAAPTRLLLAPTAVVSGIYLLGLATAELLLLTGGLVAGAAAHGILVAVLLVHAIAAPRAPYRRLLIVLVLPSLIRLLGLTVPVAATPVATWYLTAGTPALLAAILAARLIGLPTGLLARPASLWLQLMIAISGVTNGLLAYLGLRPPALPGGPMSALVTAVAVTVFAAGLEELVFRGSLQFVAAELFASPVAGIAVSTSVFALMYVGSLSVPFIVLMLATGLFLGWAVQQTGSLWGSIGAHAAMVIGLMVVWPLVLP